MTRREFMLHAGGVGMLAMPWWAGRSGTRPASSPAPVTLFLCGDVMTGRGIDQLLSHAGDPTLHEPYVGDARSYVELAERRHGRIARPVEPDYIWGEALDVMAQRRPDLRIVNLETAVTVSDEFWPGKGIHYRMQPANVECLAAAGIDCCVLANNHVLDWGHAGLVETLATLRRAGIATAGAGGNLREAEAPAILAAAGRRVLVFACGSPTSGIPRAWAAGRARPGLSLLPDSTDKAAERLAGRIAAVRRADDLVVASIHWGPNWGYEIPDSRRRLARQLIDEAGVDVVHGHSSHHPLGIEVHRGRPILYGCGDFLNDYEGIGGHEENRDLVLGYFATFAARGGVLAELVMVPFQSRRLQLRRASNRDVEWLRRTLDRECGRLGTGVEERPDGSLALRWAAAETRL
jgi:poly-gamma-glutamate capsule biosynthesis protein CapA/YwtB (metallophosphatase superfamily)